MQFISTRYGKFLTCFLLASLIFGTVILAQKISTNKIIKENDENRAKSLHFFIDR